MLQVISVQGELERPRAAKKADGVFVTNREIALDTGANPHLIAIGISC
jgi:hypothetical protein